MFKDEIQLKLQPFVQVELAPALDAAAVRDDRELQEQPHEGRQSHIRLAILVLLHTEPSEVLSRQFLALQRDDEQCHDHLHTGRSRLL
jgi:hypothetical protein